MLHRLRALMLVVIIGCLVAGCGASPVTKEASTVLPPPLPTQMPLAPTATVPQIGGTLFSVDAQQAREVATVMNMIQAYNAGQLAEALAFFDESIGYSDCDYRAIQTVSGRGRDEATQWLQRRFSDHDQQTVRRIENTNTASGLVVAVTYTSRASDTLRSLGFPNGIEPQLATKVIFTQTRDRIMAFANGPYGGSSELCRPETVP